MDPLAVCVVDRRVWLPADSVIEGEAGGYLPGILCVQGHVPLPVVESKQSALGKCRGRAQQEVRQDTAGRRPVNVAVPLALTPE